MQQLQTKKGDNDEVSIEGNVEYDHLDYKNSDQNVNHCYSIDTKTLSTKNQQNGAHTVIKLHRKKRQLDERFD